MKKPRPSSPAEYEAEIDRVRLREERRLLTEAQRAGYFDLKVTTPQLRKMFGALLKDRTRVSQLRGLEEAMNDMKSNLSKQQRKDDTRRKILLGSFLINQMEHRPEDFGWVKQELEKFLDTHTKAHFVARNKALLNEFLR